MGGRQFQTDLTAFGRLLTWANYFRRELECSDFTPECNSGRNASAASNEMHNLYLIIRTEFGFLPVCAAHNSVIEFYRNPFPRKTQHFDQVSER